ncbi:MAG: hypothetical protein ACPKQO_03390 [Nitrososphaeraceae archaeon]
MKNRQKKGKRKNYCFIFLVKFVNVSEIFLSSLVVGVLVILDHDTAYLHGVRIRNC